jgi:7-cyano-7-deazaguanine reductase
MVLGKVTEYVDQYDPSLLEAIPRQLGRQALGIKDILPFVGADVWHGYELSWLDEKGKPCVGCAKFVVPCSSPYLIESKSFKLYLNSFNQTVFGDIAMVEKALVRDLTAACGDAVGVVVQTLDRLEGQVLQGLTGECLDHLPIEVTQYQPDPGLLQSDGAVVSECLVSHLLKSNCPVTNQPDWGSVQVVYTGEVIDRAGLLRYIISFRQHQGFHEQCVEQIFWDIWQRCKPAKLAVYGYYTRRGGLDINPFRSSDQVAMPLQGRLVRQ